MKKSEMKRRLDITGWKDIFSFTLKQTLKTKSYRITLIVFCLIAAIGLPAASYFMTEDTEAVEMDGEYADDAQAEGDVEEEDGASERKGKIELTHLKKVYISYPEEQPVEKLIERLKKRYDLEVESVDDAQAEEQRKLLNEHSDTCLLLIKRENGVYSVEVVTGWDTRKSSEDIDRVTGWLSERLRELQVSSVISEEYLEDVGKEVKTYTDGKESATDSSPTGFMGRYSLWLTFIVVMIFFVTYAGQHVANSIIVEKSSKLIEYLLISVKPMAIVAGKVLAILVGLFIQLGAMALSGILSVLFSENLFSFSVAGGLSEIVKSMKEQSVLAGFSGGNVILAVLIILTGLLFFSLIASIAGASVSKIEESAEGMVLFTLLVIIGAYLSMAVSMGNLFQETGEMTGGFALICCLIPVTSVFSVPANLLMGCVPLWLGLTSLFLLLAGTVVVLILAAKIYEYLLFYNGAVLKPRDILYIIRYGKVRGEE